MKWLIILSLAISFIAHANGKAGLLAELNARYLGKTAYWLAPEGMTIRAVITKVIVPESVASTDDISQVKFEVRGSMVKEGESVLAALPHAPSFPPAPEPDPQQDDGIRMPQVIAWLTDAEGFSWHTRSGFAFELLAAAEEIGYTIDASQVFPESLHVGKEIRFNFRASQEIHTATVTAIWHSKLDEGVTLWVEPAVNGKVFIAAKDIEILAD